MKVALENVTKEFQGKNRTVTAVNNLSVTLESGKLVGFLGPSGCGKSTTLFMLAGIYDANNGKIFFDEKDVTKVPPENRNIGMVFQNYALYPHLTVKENIEFPLVNSPKMKKEIKGKLFEEKSPLTFKEFVIQRVAEVAKLVEITEYLERKPAELSGGQQQRVAIARALVKRPSLLLLDEPLSNLDARLRLQTREEIRKIQKETGITTIFVTHDQEEALNICDKIVIMKDGIFQQQGTPQQVYDEPINLFTARFLGTPPINLMDGEIRDNMLWVAGKPWKELPEEGLPDQLVTIGIRTENIYIAEDSENELLPVTVTETIRLGGVKTAKVSLENGQIISVFQDNRKDLLLGSEIKIGVLTNAIIVFGEDDRRILQW